MRFLLICILLIVALPICCKTVEESDESKSDNSEIINKIIEEKLAIINKEISVNEFLTIKTKITSEKIAFNLNIKF